MVPSSLNLEMEGRHVIVESGSHEFIWVGARRGAVPARAVEETRNGAYGLQEGRHAELVE
jgi:hypothetical protein